MSKLPIECGIPVAPKQRLGRKKVLVPMKAADAVRTGKYSIKEAAHKFFDEHIGSKRRTSRMERLNENEYAERFRDFVVLIVNDLKAKPKPFNVYRRLGELHLEKMKNSAYRRSYQKKISKRFRKELLSLGLLE